MRYSLKEPSLFSKNDWLFIIGCSLVTIIIIWWLNNTYSV
jgi:hypothetical protein